MAYWKHYYHFHWWDLLSLFLIQPGEYIYDPTQLVSILRHLQYNKGRYSKTNVLPFIDSKLFWYLFSKESKSSFITLSALLLIINRRHLLLFECIIEAEYIFFFFSIQNINKSCYTIVFSFLGIVFLWWKIFFLPSYIYLEKFNFFILSYFFYNLTRLLRRIETIYYHFGIWLPFINSKLFWYLFFKEWNSYFITLSASWLVMISTLSLFECII